jgi:hypothetical protein
MNYKNTLIIFLSSVLLSWGCAGQKIIKEEVISGAKGGLSFISGEKGVSEVLIPDAYQTMVDEKTNTLIFDWGKEKLIKTACGVDIGLGEESFTATVAGLLVAPAIKGFLNLIEARLTKEQEKYIKKYRGGKETLKFYSQVGNSLKLNYPCFRFVRKYGKDDKEIAMDLIGQFKIFNNDILKIRPLRLYYVKPMAKGKEIGLAISLKANSAWKQQNEGKREDIFNQILISDKRRIEKDANNNLSYYSFEKNKKNEIVISEDWSSFPFQKLIPWSTNRTKEGGNVTMTLTVAEVGKMPKILEYSAKIITKNKDKLGELLIEAANNAVSGEESE